MSVPWKLEAELRKVDIPGVGIFSVPVYESQLVDEAVLWAQMRREQTPSLEACRKYVLFALKLREVIDSNTTDEEVSKHITVGLINELFELFYYGVKGPPDAATEEVELTEKKKSTGLNSTGNADSTTQASKHSKTLANAQST